MSIESERDRLSQAHNLEWIGRKLKATDMVTVYRQMGSPRDYFIFSALIPPDQIEYILSNGHMSSGDPENMNGMPAAYCPSGESEIKYFRWGVDEDMYGAEPLVIKRRFSGMEENYIEILEEFRLFHNLYHEKETNTYIKIDDAGNKNKIAIVKPDEVQIRYQEIRQFLAIKEMYLSMLFEFDEYSTYSLQELGLSEDEPCKFMRQDLIFCRHHYYVIPSSLSSFPPYQGFRSASRLRGRRLIKPLPKSKSGFGDFAEKPKYVKFIVDVADNGDEIFHTCDPYKLSDRLGKNSDAVSKYTVVHFRKQVLDKYYNEPSRYSIEDSMVRCRSLWSMQIDNHDPDKVCVYLDELGIHLPPAEQLHWREYNIPPEGGVSETFDRRMRRGEWASSDQPDILFKQSYEQLQKACDECLGWQLLKPLPPGDAHRLQRLRIPTVEEESHFKDLVSDLTSVLVEALNEKRLKDLIPNDQQQKIKRGINRLEYVLEVQAITGAEKHIVFLRSLWGLRTTRSSSHLEILDDKRYEKAAAHFDLNNMSRQEAFAKILGEAVEFLDFLISVVRGGKLKNKNDES